MKQKDILNAFLLLLDTEVIFDAHGFISSSAIVYGESWTCLLYMHLVQCQ